MWNNQSNHHPYTPQDQASAWQAQQQAYAPASAWQNSYQPYAAADPYAQPYSYGASHQQAATSYPPATYDARYASQAYHSYGAAPATTSAHAPYAPSPSAASDPNAGLYASPVPGGVPPWALQPPPPHQPYGSDPASLQPAPPPEQPYNPYFASVAASVPWLQQPPPPLPAYGGNAAGGHSSAPPLPNASAYRPDAAGEGADVAASYPGAYTGSAHYSPGSYGGAYTYDPAAAAGNYQPAASTEGAAGGAGPVGEQALRWGEGGGGPAEQPPLPEEPAAALCEAQPPLPGAPPLPDATAADAPAAAPMPVLPPTDALELFSQPGRAARPRAFAILIRGIPGSGKSLIAAKLRKLEQDAGGQPPRVHSLDAYFMNEVEKDEGGVGRARRIIKVEEYEYEPSMEGVYEENLLRAFARTLAERQHPVVIVDAPLLRAARLHDFWATAQAAGFEVFVTQSPQQEPQECYRRNVHGRSYLDIQRSKEHLEPVPPAMATLDVARILDGGTTTTSSAALAPPLTAKRKSDGIDADRGHRGGSDASHAAAGLKRQKSSSAADRDLLASINEGFMRMDEGEDGAAANGQAKAAPAPKAAKAAPKSRWEASDDEEEVAPAAARPVESKTSAADAKLQELMSAHAKVTKKTVRWPDQEPDDDVDAFRIGRPRQLEVIHYVTGLGPQNDEDGDLHPHLSFSQAARAEHELEKKSHVAGGWS